MHGWRRTVRWSFDRFRYAFVHPLPPGEQHAAYDRHVTPETVRVFFQGALSLLSPGGPRRVDFGKRDRAPLLIVAGGDDRIVPASVVRRTHAKYRGSGAVTDYAESAGRTHWIIAQDGWEEVAGRIDGWLREHDVAAASAAPAPGSDAAPS
jgi:alpha-beta hydrolase superfamily lysophospholipase